MVKYTICVLGVYNFGLFDSPEEAKKVLEDKGWLKVPDDCMEHSMFEYYLPYRNPLYNVKYRSLCNIIPFVMPFSCDKLWSDK